MLCPNAAITRAVPALLRQLDHHGIVSRQADQDALIADALEQVLQYVQFVLPVEFLGERSMRRDPDGFAFRGVGKTWLALAIAEALSTAGKLGDWQAHESVRVVYVDGEMPPDLMRDRTRGRGEEKLEFLNHLILFERTGKVLNITNHEVQQALTAHCIAKNVRVLILDNLSTLGGGMKDQRRIVQDPRHRPLLLDELWENVLGGAFCAGLFDPLGDKPAILFTRYGLEHPLEADRIVPDVQGSHRSIIAHSLPVDAHGVDRGPRGVALGQPDMARRDDHTRDQTLEIPFPRRGKRSRRDH